MKRALIIAVAGVVTVSASAAQETWPSRPVKVIVASAPGGGLDTYARMLAHGLSDSLKQQFLVENRPGAGGNVGVDAVAKSAPDGYTALVAATAAITLNQYLYKNIPYDAERDLAPVTQGVTGPSVLYVNPAVPARTLADLVTLGKRDPGKLGYGSAGVGTSPHLGVRLLEEATGARFLHVPFKGVGQANQGFLSGQVQFMLAPVATALSMIRSGKAMPLAVTDRPGVLPSTPPIPQAGFPGVEISNSFSVLLPAGTPAAIVRRLSAEAGKAMKSPMLAEKFDALALVPVFDTPEQFAAKLKRQRQAWSAFVSRGGIEQVR